MFLAYAAERGHALIDRRLYLPEDWLDDEHRREGRIPADVAFATKPAMARTMIAQALDAGVPCGWVAADALYGSDKSLRVLLEQRAVPYVLAVRGNEVLNVLTAGQANGPQRQEGHQQSVTVLERPGARVALGLRLAHHTQAGLDEAVALNQPIHFAARRHRLRS
ncbi:Mobile element protein [Azospirillum argentinense]